MIVLDFTMPLVCTLLSEGPKGGRRKGGRGRKLSHFSFCCAFRCCEVYSPCFPVWGEEKVMTVYDGGPLAAGPLCGLLMLTRHRWARPRKILTTANHNYEQKQNPTNHPLELLSQLENISNPGILKCNWRKRKFSPKLF